MKILRQTRDRDAAGLPPQEVEVQLSEGAEPIAWMLHEMFKVARSEAALDFAGAMVEVCDRYVAHNAERRRNRSVEKAMSITDPYKFKEAIDAGLLETFTDPVGENRVRMTPKGARALAQEPLACALEACKQGRHGKFAASHPYCACGEQSIVVQDES